VIYLLDTVAVVRHFTGFGKIGRSASAILDGIEDTDDFLVISVVSLMEIMYLAEKNRIRLSLRAALRTINTSSSYLVLSLNPEILKVAEEIAFPELHDRLILASAKWLGVPVLSSDAEFPEVEGIETIWS
jgi:predicted nucleic acid-binding protein